MARKLLLASTSRTHGTGYLDHCADEITAILSGTGRLLFVPFALHDHDAYAARARERFLRMGFELESAHEAVDPRRSVEDAEAIFVGGGNTFRLLRRLYDLDLLAPIRRRVSAGVPYLGASDGANVAGPTIKTTNDMPIVEPPSFEALALVPFQINPHYLDPDPGSTHMGETRETRISEFLEDNDNAVVGLREGAMLRIEGGAVALVGSRGARLFRRDRDPEELEPGARLDFLLDR